ncbi:MAG: ABC transporter substrate-binding protein [Candidatus Limnocylindrales bacterium]|jgi:polar amino acid transport system substrate-binding protein
MHVIPSRIRIAGVLAAAAIVVGACSSAAATPTPTPAPPTPVATVGPVATPAPTPTPAPTQKVVGTVPPDQLVVAGHLTVCSDIPYPPQEFFDANGNPTGSDIDIGNEIANRLGLKLAVQNTVFDTIIAALAGNKCDIIISAQNITADRLKAVDMIPYFHAGQSFVVAKGNPDGIKATADLCGKSVGVENGTTEADHLNGTGDYKPADGLSAQCVAAGKAKINVQPFTKDSDALLALQSGKVSAYFTDSPVAGYYTVQQPTLFEVVSGLILDDVKEGISVGKANTGLESAVKTALQSMIDDGTYVQILTKYGVQADAVTSTNS